VCVIKGLMDGFPLFVGLFAVVLAVLYDMKTREVPDILNYLLVVFASGWALFSSLLSWSYEPLLSAFLGGAAAFVFGSVMYYTGQWGGGDTKLLLGLGILLGISIGNVLDGSLLLLLINILVWGSVWGILATGYTAFRNRKKFVEAYTHFSRKMRVERFFCFVGFLVVLMLALFLIDPFRILLAVVAFLIPLLFYLTLFSRALEKSCMVKKYAVSRLTEGDWLVEDVKKGNRVLVRKNLEGISSEEILVLKKSSVGHVLVKEGIPFTPSFLMAYLFMLLVGNWLKFLFAF